MANTGHVILTALEHSANHQVTFSSNASGLLNICKLLGMHFTVGEAAHIMYKKSHQSLPSREPVYPASTCYQWGNKDRTGTTDRPADKTLHLGCFHDQLSWFRPSIFKSLSYLVTGTNLICSTTPGCSTHRMEERLNCNIAPISFIFSRGNC